MNESYEQPPLAPQDTQSPFLPYMATQTKTPEVPTNDFYWYRLSSEDILEQIKHQLRGEVQKTDKKGVIIYEKEFDSWMNEDGISKVMYILYSCGINKNIILGNLTHEEIMDKCRSLWLELSKLFAFNYLQYEVDKTMRSVLIKSIVYPIHSALSRSELGREADQLATAAQRIEHVMHDEEKKSEGILSSMNPFRRRK